MSFSGFNPDTDVPSLAGKVIFLTAGTAGIGRSTIVELAKHSPAHIYFTGRNQSAANDIISSAPASVPLTFLPCDAASLASVRAAADKFLASSPRLDVLIANLGILAEIPGVTADGYEVTFGTNHMSNAAFLMAFLPLMLSTAAEPGSDVRFVSLTSQGAAGHPADGIVFPTLKSTQEGRPMTFGGWSRYGQSKLANVLLAKEVSRRYPQITGVAVHPGVVETAFVTGMNFANRLLTRTSQVIKGGLITPRQGAYNTLWAATGADLRKCLERDAGKVAWYEPVRKVAKGTTACHDEKLAAALWEYTVKELGVKL